MLLAAKQNPSLRRYVLSTFRKQISLPKLREFDRDQHQLACSDILIGLGFSPSQLQVSFFKLEWELSALSCSSVTWRNFRIWTLVRITGRWPLPIFGYTELPLEFNCCACSLSVGVLHSLLICPRSREAWNDLRTACPWCPSRDFTLAFLQFIFGEAAPWPHVQNFAGACLQANLTEEQI